MHTHPVIFSERMVEAILAGKKTQTRRVIKPQPPAKVKCPYGEPGDLLWVKETWALSVRDPEGGDEYDDPDNYDVVFKAGKEDPEGEWEHHEVVDGKLKRTMIKPPWRSPRFMPKRHARLWLKITDIRSQKLSKISKEDVLAEGIEPITDEQAGLLYHESFAEAWDRLHRRDGFSWAKEPWVWALSFERSSCPSSQ